MESRRTDGIWCAVHEGPAIEDPCNQCLIWRFDYCLDLARRRGLQVGQVTNTPGGRSTISERTPFGVRIQTLASGRP
jgi:hypothetical protein